MSDIPLDRQVLIVSRYGLRDLDGIVSKAHEPLQVGCVQEWLKRYNRAVRRIIQSGKAPDNGTPAQSRSKAEKAPAAR